MSFGIEFLVILFTIITLFAVHLLRMVLSQRIPDRMLLRRVSLERPPAALADLFEASDRELRRLGFTDPAWAAVQSEPGLAGMVPPLLRVYRHAKAPILARVTPPHTVFGGDRCTVVLLSVDSNKRVLATANRLPELFPRPPEELTLLVNSDVDSVREQLEAHVAEMKNHAVKWLSPPAGERRQEWMVKLLSHYEAEAIAWLQQEGHVKRLPGGGSTASLRHALRFLAEALTGRQHQVKPESDPLPLARAAYLFFNWRHAGALPPALSFQLALFAISSLLFVLLAGLLWDWRFAALLLVVILFHEAGHWLTMRLLGYRNLQILMLPLVGGVASGREARPLAANRALVSLMGPLPGIIVGWLLLLVGGMESGWIFTLALMLLAVNYFNLLPIMPLDGGQLMKSLIPPRRLVILAGFEFLAIPALLLLGWLSESAIITLLALAPFFGGLALLKSRRMIQHLENEGALHQSRGELAQIEAAIATVDDFDKQYRPLSKKLQEIDGLLTMLQIRPARPATIGVLLGVYLGCFALPLAMLPSMPGLLAGVFATDERPLIDPEPFYQRAADLGTPQLLAQIVREKRIAFGRYDEHQMRDIRHPPASEEAIAATEARLGIGLPANYRAFLKLSNGLGDEWTKSANWLLPVEELARVGDGAPRLLADLREAQAMLGADGEQGLFVEDYSDEPAVDKRLAIAELEQMVILGGIPELGQYLLLASRPQGGYDLFQLDEGFSAVRYGDFRAFLGATLAEMWIATAYLEDVPEAGN